MSDRRAGVAESPNAESADILHTAAAGPAVVRGTVWRVSGYAVGALLTAMASVLLLRYLGVGAFGRYATVMAIVAIVSGVSDAGLTVVGTRELSMREPGAGRRELLAELVGLRMVLTPVGAALGVAFAALAGYGHELVIGTALAGAGIVLVNTQSTLMGLLPVELRNVRLTLAEVLKYGVTVLVIALLVVAGASLVAFFAGQIVVGIVMLAATPLVLGRGQFTRPRFSRPAWKRLLGQSVPVAVAYALGLIYFRLLLILLSLVSSDQQVGLFGTSLRIFEMLMGIPTLAMGVALPALAAAAARSEQFRYRLRRVSEGAVLLAVLVALATGLAAEPITVVLGGSEYRPAAEVLQVHIVGLVPMFVSNVCQTSLIALGRQRALIVVNAAALAFLTAMGLILVPHHHAMGAAVAAALGETVLATLGVLALARYGFRGLPSAGFTARAALAAALGLVAGVLPGLPAAPAAVLAVLVYAAVVIALRLLPPELLDALRPLLPAARRR